MHDILNSQSYLKADTLVFDFRGGIPSSHAAVSIKFGLEALPSVGHVSFIGDSIEVTINSEGTLLDSLWAALSLAGFEKEDIHLRDENHLLDPVDRLEH